MHDWAWTAGMGLRIDIPGFPLRFDYAWPIVRDEQLTRTERFSFLIGIE
jgi:outer membrane protein assembly factor BamA